MPDTIHREVNFETYITRKLAELAQTDNWVVSDNDTGFDPNTALYMSDFVAYQQAIAPEKIQKMQTAFGSNWESNLRAALIKSLENVGTVLTLRDGFSMAGFQTIVCSGHYPDNPALKDVAKQYDANILRVMRQVHYQTAGEKSLDLVFFINGIPVATAEIKTELTQTVQDAILEYQNERKPIEPGTRRKNYLLLYKRGAIVHFAISESEIWMCTNLESKKPKFLPFNMGKDGHAGNPDTEKDSPDYPTHYFWDYICRKENWLNIYQHFIFEKEEKVEDVTGHVSTVYTQLFPRYHQFDCVTKVVRDVREKGPGQRYLIEHSAGSGKTETITWISHELIRILNEDGSKMFSSVIVVTNRIGLDTNIKKTIKQLKKTVGLIEMIGGDGDKKTAGAKSKQLAKALHDKREIIVVTLQTFPFAMEAIAKDDALVGCKFAVLIDEAHSSQDGDVASQMKAALKAASDKKAKTDINTATDEEAVNAYFMKLQSDKVMPENVSFFAFTATPKSDTFTIFGRPGDRTDPKTGRPINESFHLYPMRQAIEEGYIIDVLQGYMAYDTAYRLKEDIVPDTLVDVRSAMRTIAKWEGLHPTNVMSKAEFIVEHFVKNVAAMLDGQAKAMIVTASRASVIRYKYAISAYLKAHPEYDKSKVPEKLQFKVPGEPLVAFSDKISGSKCVMDEDEYLENNPFAMIRTDYDYTEENMNQLGFQTVENAFNTPNYRIMIVADKFQTGFNQPKLCAMYIDKKIANDIEIVQTYSRLNRTHSGKDHVYVIDFVNDPQTVLNAFKTYDNGAAMQQAQNLDVVYEIKRKLDQMGIYDDDEFQTFKHAKYGSVIAIDEEKDSYRQALYKAVSIPAERWNNAMEAQRNAYQTWMGIRERALENGNKENAKEADKRIAAIEEEITHLLDFRKGLRKYCAAYAYITQIIDLGDADLEVFYAFAKLLEKRIVNTPLDEIDVKSLVLADYRINALDVNPDAGTQNEIRPINSSLSASDSKKKSLKEIIAKLNEIWGENTDPVTAARAVNAMADIVESDDVARIQIRNSTNSKEAVIADGRLMSIIQMAALSLKNNDMRELAEKIVDDPQTWEPLAEMIYGLISKKSRVDITDLKSALE